MMRTAIALFLLLGVMILSEAAHAATTDEARQFVDNVGKQALTIINTKDVAEDARQKQLQQLFANNVAIDWMAQFVLGRAWQQASAEQRQQYQKAYRDYLLTHYTNNFADYSGSKYKITGVRDIGNDQFQVAMQIDTPGQNEETEAGYRLRVENGQFKISDIVIEGVSLITTQRSEFSSLVQQGGMNKLIASLQNKTQEEQQSSRIHFLVAYSFASPASFCGRLIKQD